MKWYQKRVLEVTEHYSYDGHFLGASLEGVVVMDWKKVRFVLAIVIPIIAIIATAILYGVK